MDKEPKIKITNPQEQIQPLQQKDNTQNIGKSIEPLSGSSVRGALIHNGIVEVSGAPYTNSGYIEVVIGNKKYKIMITA